jgi:2-octaprenylphenol hydroxylase
LSGPATTGGAAQGRSAGRDFDIIVAGSGVTATAMASLAVARKLAAPGRVAVLAEWLPPLDAPAASGAEWDLRVFAMSRASQRMLTLCGAWQHLPPSRLCAYERMCVWEAGGGDSQGRSPGGAGSLCFDSAELGEPNLGFIVEGRALQIASRRAAGAAGVVFIEAGIAGIEADRSGVRIRLRDGRDIQGELLIAADGAESPVRELLGIETAGHAYHQDALVAHVRTEKPHLGTARQRFLPTGPLAFLPLPDGRSSIVWSALRAEADRLRSLDAAAFGAALTAASGGFLGACELTTPIASFPLKLQYAVDYVRPRAVLVGDAAHAVHPLAGQGLNLGFLDCAVLAEVLDESRKADPKARSLGERRLLRRYERRRKSENLLAATAMDGMERLFAIDDPLVARLRGASLSAVDRLPFVKRELAMRAMGLRGDIPAFLKVEPEAFPG